MLVHVWSQMSCCKWLKPGTHYMKVTTYAPPFRPPFFGSLENLYSFYPYILTKMRKMYFDPYFSSKLGKMYSFDSLFFTLVAFRVSRRCWASLSQTWPSIPPPPPQDFNFAVWHRTSLHKAMTSQWSKLRAPSSLMLLSPNLFVLSMM